MPLEIKTKIRRGVFVLSYSKVSVYWQRVFEFMSLIKRTTVSFNESVALLKHLLLSKGQATDSMVVVHKSRFLSLPDIQDFSRGLKLKDATICLCQEWEGNKNNPSPTFQVPSHSYWAFILVLHAKPQKLPTLQFFTLILQWFFLYSFVSLVIPLH